MNGLRDSTGKEIELNVFYRQNTGPYEHIIYFSFDSIDQKFTVQDRGDLPKLRLPPGATFPGQLIKLDITPAQYAAWLRREADWLEEAAVGLEAKTAP
jgi:hypothetical protein